MGDLGFGLEGGGLGLKVWGLESGRRGALFSLSGPEEGNNMTNAISSRGFSRADKLKLSARASEL